MKFFNELTQQRVCSSPVRSSVRPLGCLSTVSTGSVRLSRWPAAVFKIIRDISTKKAESVDMHHCAYNGPANRLPAKTIWRCEHVLSSGLLDSARRHFTIINKDDHQEIFKSKNFLVRTRTTVGQTKRFIISTC